jgi:hypothetical protein
MPLRHATPKRGLLATMLVCALVAPVAAQPKKGGGKHDPAPAADTTKTTDKPADSGDKKKDPKVKNFDFNALDLNGRMRTPQLLYFLERANEELERASLEKRSFIPHMVRSVEEEQL